jgi:hypothetical protein
MSLSAPLEFEALLASLGRLGNPSESSSAAPSRTVIREAVAHPSHAIIREAADHFVSMSDLDTTSLAAVIAQNPTWVPALGLVAGLSQERLKNELRHRFRTSGWVTLARKHSSELVAYLASEFQLLDKLKVERDKRHTLADVLLARAEGRQSAGGAVSRGRDVEDQIQSIVEGLGVSYRLRTTFRGRGGCEAPCDFAIPGSGEEARIVCAAKGFNSTGSKLTDSVREVIAMADCRLPRQYVFAVVDGIGWRSRQADLRRLYELWIAQKIDGLFTLNMLSQFKAALQDAIARLGLTP